MSRVLSGMRPTGPLHLGHWLGAIRNWVELQKRHECFFMVADLHALMGEYENPENIRKHSLAMVRDWLSFGINPDLENVHVFIQSEIAEHAELALILGMMTPLGWLERNPTYKEQLREVEGRDLTTYGFLGYPVLQAADILLYKANKVPVGEDQLAHLELSREIVRRFKHLYKKDVFPEPEALLTKEARILGTDRRKMSKSYGNTINLSDTDDAVQKKVLTMVTDPARKTTKDPGHPEVCNVYSYYQMFTEPDLVRQAHDWCTQAQKGCVDCKKIMSAGLTTALNRERARFQGNDKDVERILDRGRQKAQAVARATLAEVKSLLHL